MFAQFLLDFSQHKVCFAQELAFSKVAKTEGEVFVTLLASQDDLEPSRATILTQSPCSLIPGYDINPYANWNCLIETLLFEQQSGCERMTIEIIS